MTNKEQIKIAKLLKTYRKLVKLVDGINRLDPLFDVYINLGGAVDDYIFDMAKKLKLTNSETVNLLNKIIDEENL